MLYPHTDLPEAEIEARVRAMGTEERLAVVRAYVRRPRRTAATSPGRALERSSYRFDVLTDYGAFRDLQRHRMLTIEWQRLTPRHGFTRPEAVDAAGGRAASTRRWSARPPSTTPCEPDFPEQASYAVALAYRVRFVMQMNAREAMHLLELRTTPQGHPAYRLVGPADARAHRRGGRPPRRGRDDALRRPLPSPSSSASRPSAGPRPAARAALTARPAYRSGRTNAGRSLYDPRRDRPAGSPTRRRHG